jgi:hypothetical protein
MGDKPEPPQPPNPVKVSGLQTQSNVSTAVANAWLNNTDTYGPLGSTEYQTTGYETVRIPAGKDGQKWREIRVPTFRQINKLSADQQRLLDLQESTGHNLGRLAVDQSARMQDYLRQGMDPNLLPDDVRNAAQAEQLQTAVSPDNFSADRQRVEEALYSRLNPQLERDRASLDTRLANQGITQNSEAYNKAIDEMNRKSNDARMQVVLGAGQEQNRLYGLEQQRVGQANQAIQGNYANQMSSDQAQQTLRQQALQEMAFFRNQPLSELSQLMHGSAPTMPQFQGWSGPTVANTDVSGNFYRSAALEQQNYLAQQQQQNAMMGGLFGLGGSMMGLFSDRRLKENIKRIGKADNGIPLYLYNYIGETEPRIGPMADEVEKVKPEAVGEFGGFKTVRYDLALGA